jgi:hypothetical protein
MGFVPDFASDIFISYARADNQRLAPDDRGWVTDLHTVLDAKLFQELHVKPKIWRDIGGLDGSGVHAGIKEQLGTSAVLLALVSGTYLASDYCRLEREIFANYEHPAFPLVIRNHKRIVVAVLDAEEDTPRAGWPAILQDAPCAIFCETEVATRRRVRFERPARSGRDPYWERIDDLLRHIKSVLREMRKGPTSDAAVAEMSTRFPATTGGVPAWREARRHQPNGCLVYVLHRTVDPTDVVNELRERKYAVTLLDHDKAEQLQRRHEANLRFCDGLMVLYGSNELPWAEYITQEAWMIAQQNRRPKKLGVVSQVPADDRFGFLDDLVVTMRLAPSGQVIGLEEFVRTLTTEAV